jgi:signal transduction histidine kinase
MAASMMDLEKMRSSFLSNVSHDLRTPMTTISGFIDGMIDGTIPKEKHEYYLKLISNEVKRLSRLVSALLDISRIQAGERKFTESAFDICEMARVILISFEQQIEKKKLDVEFDVESDNIFVSADRDAIYQILYNICDNAVKFSSEGGKYRIKITEKDKRIFVSVYNEGIGIPSDELPHVFERFYKNDKSRSLDKTGIGLGMYIAKSIIDAHNEEIWVKSKYGEYCEFVFTVKKATEGQIKKSYSRD